MSGSILAVLSGMATPVVKAPNWDHTYVVSDCGWIWRCWGNFDGGAVLSSSGGNSFLANCISKPRGTAGIYAYGVNGVCHQAANRILLPARIRVENARGYYLSESIFGAYGTGPWIARVAECHAQASESDRLMNYDHPSAQGQTKEKASKMPQDRPAPPSLSEILEFAEQASTPGLDEVRKMCEARGVSVSVSELEKLARVRFFAQQDQQAYAYRLLAGELDGNTYLKRLDGVVDDFLKASKSVVGTERFSKIFGEAVLQPGGLVNREEFFKSIESSRSEAAE